MINWLVNRYLPQIEKYDDEHANDFKYYKKKTIILFLYHNYRVLQLLFLVIALLGFYLFLRAKLQALIPNNAMLIGILAVFLINILLSIRFIFRIFKSIFTQSKTGYLTNFESKRK